MAAHAEMHMVCMLRTGLAELSVFNLYYLPGDVAPQIAQFARCPETVVSSSLLVNPGLDLCDAVYADSCYVIVSESLTWQEARSVCGTLDGHLVTIESQEENDAINILKGSKYYKVLQILRTD